MADAQADLSFRWAHTRFVGFLMSRLIISGTVTNVMYYVPQVPSIEVYNVDLADWEKSRAMVESIGPIDLLVNNAAVCSWTPFFDVTKEELDKWVFSTHF